MVKFSDQELLKRTNHLRSIERTTTSQLLRYFAEINRRRLFADLGHSSLFDYLTKNLGYSEGQASRRISAMRLIQANPLAQKKVDSGELNLATAAIISRHISSNHLPVQEQNNLIERVSGKSKRDCEKIIAPAIAAVKRDVTRRKDQKNSRISFDVSDELLKKLQQVKEICGKHKYEELLEKICDSYIDQHKKSLTKTTKSQKTQGRTISAPIKRKLMVRSSGRCEWRHPLTHERCSCKTNLEVDHILPFSMGGSNELSNLRLYCKNHNQRAAIKILGQEKMDQFINKTFPGARKPVQLKMFD